MADGPPIPVFDVGGVLLDWNPRHLYRTLIPDEDAREHFLATVCTPLWNLEMDRGRPWADGVGELVARFPEHAPLIRAFDERWPEMVAGVYEDTVAILEALLDSGRAVYCITNFSADKFALARTLFPFLDRFTGIVVSGEVGLIKPDPAIFRCLLDRYRLDAARCLFIDDMAVNVRAAEAVGMAVHHHVGAAGLRGVLTEAGLL